MTKNRQEWVAFNLVRVFIMIIDSNGSFTPPEQGCSPFWSNSIAFNENRIANIITELLQR